MLISGADSDDDDVDHGGGSVSPHINCCCAYYAFDDPSDSMDSHHCTLSQRKLIMAKSMT